MKLSIQKRQITGRKVKNLRADGFAPGSLYGPNLSSINFSVETTVFKSLFDKVGYSSLFDLEIDKKSIGKAIVKEVQLDPITGAYLNISLYQVDMKKEINAEIPIVIEGNSPAVKNNYGLLVSNLEEIAIRCLPSVLPSEFTINIDKLENIGDSIKISDLNLPSGLELDSSLTKESVIVYVAPPQKTLAEETPAEEKVEEEQKESEEKESNEESS